jgi:hypothetical protein
MIQKRILVPERIRKINGSFAFIEHRFMKTGLFSMLNRDERSLYLFLVLVADRFGLSYYSYDRVCRMTGLLPDEYIEARNSLIDKDLIAFDGCFFQVLSLPDQIFDDSPGPIRNREEMERHDSATIIQNIKKSWEES